MLMFAGAVCVLIGVFSGARITMLARHGEVGRLREEIAVLRRERDVALEEARQERLVNCAKVATVPPKEE